MLATDPIDLALTADGDIEIPLRHTTGIAAVAQGISIRLRMFRGEWFLNLDEGVPYLEGNGVTETAALLGQVFDKSKSELTIRAIIAKVPGVVSVDRVNATFDGATREMTIDWKVTTSFDDTAEDTLNIPVLDEEI